MVIHILQPAEYQNFESFKKVVSCILGHTKHFVQEQFYTITRNPNETIGCFFGRFVGLARKLFLKTEPDFPNSMKNYLVTTFIYKLPLELKQKLLAEESNLNFSNLVERAQELESIFNIQPEKPLPIEPSVSYQNSISNDIKNLTSTTDKKLIKLEAIISQLSDQSERKKPRKMPIKKLRQIRTKNPVGFFNGIKCSRLRGFCAFEILGSGCCQEL